jgi:gluconolactonase
MRFLFALALCCTSASAQDFTEYNVERVALNQRFTEGPVWTAENILVFSDTPNNKLMRWVPNEGVQVHRENTPGASGNAVDAQGRLYICESGARRVIRIDKRNRVEVLAEKWEGKRLNAPNDIVVRKDGHVWFTDPAFGSAADHRELDFWGVFHITPKGVLELMAKSKGRPNGVALSADGRTLYVTDSDSRTLHAWDVEKSGAASNDRVLIANIPGVPGGVRADEKGNLYVAAKGVLAYSSDGKLLHTIELPEIPSNVAFGDSDFETLYITAQTSVYRLRLKVKGAVQR